MEFIKPHIPDWGNAKIAIIQTADSNSAFPKRYKRAVDEIKKLTKGTVTDYTEYTQKIPKVLPEKYYAELIMKAATDNDVLISLTGGYTTNCVLSYLDYTIFSDYKPVIVGYSDTTALLNAIVCQSGLITYYGPAVLGSFGEWPNANQYTVESFKCVVNLNKQKYTYSKPNYYSTSNYFWDKEDIQELQYCPNIDWLSNCDDKVVGNIIGGNLNTLLSILNTYYFRIPQGGILFLEDAFTQIDRLKRDLHSLKQKGVYERVQGIVFGKFYGCDLETGFKMSDYVNDFFTSEKIPVVANVDFGHCYPIMTLPLGGLCEVDYSKCKISLLVG